jgi:amino acid adenylation domain-containing protein
MDPYLLHQLLRRSAEAHPDRTAVVDGEREITYAELDDRSSRLARQLLDLGVRRGDRVGLFLDKSLESVVGIYGAMKAGACYVPFDPGAPVRRLAGIAADAGIRVLLSGAEKAGAWAEIGEVDRELESVVVLNEEDPGADRGGPRVVGTAAIDKQEGSDPRIWCLDRDLAYILYTSGSTGVPKGVMLTHRNAITFVDWAADLAGVTADDRLSSHAPLHFDLSVFDLYAAAWAGAAVVLVPARASVLPPELARWIHEARITVWYSVPSILTMLTDRGGLKGGEFPTLRVVYFAGEVFPTKYLRRLQQLLPHVGLFNLYGPTETNVCTWYEVPTLPEDSDEPIPIGRAIDNMDVFAVTEEGKLAPRGEIGELYVRGAGVMQGYWGDPERTARVLIENPFGDRGWDPVYRTGDLVSEDEDGNYLFLGRRDAQIKSRGYRIELGDIESALYAHPSVVECAVTAVPDDVVTNRIRAHLVVSERLDRAELIGFCAERIPRYMIPEIFEFADALPKTSTGKVDRQALAGL